MNKTIKITIAILVAASLLVLAHYLPNLDSVMRKIHGG